MASEFFKWNSISVKQNDLVFKVGTDAILLGSWIKKIVQDPLTILDAGTGCGVIALMLSEYFPTVKITAIDTDENAVILAAYNFRQNHKHHSTISRIENVLETSHDGIKYDLVVSNPPFFFGQLLSTKQKSRNAKHAVHNHEKWMQGCQGRLAENGDLCVIVPFEDAFQWIRSANKLRLYCHNRVNVNSFHQDVPVRSMLHFKKAIVKPCIETLSIYTFINTYSSAYLELTGIQPGKKL